MRAFTTLQAIAAPLPLANVDTDKIIAARFLKTIGRDGLGTALFAALRYDDSGAERADFILNCAPWRGAGILVALDNFGCGSSREHAPWALWDFGIRAIVAPSFADIFYNNCFKNGILPVVLPQATVAAMLEAAGDPSTALLRIDLAAQTVRHHDGRTTRFEISRDRKLALLEGRDDIDDTLARVEDIARWERRSRLIAPAIPLDIAQDS